MWIPIYRAKAYRHFGSFFSKVDGKSIPGGVFNYRGIVSCTLTMSESSSSPGKEKIVVMKDGPYVVSGSVPLVKENIISEGGISTGWEKGGRYPDRKAYTLCRCGRTSTPPYCDNTHTSIGFDGTETADRAPLSERCAVLEGPTLTLYDRKDLCARAGHCQQLTGAWTLVKHSDEEEKRIAAIGVVNECPAGRLVLRDKKNDEIIEIPAEKEIAVVQHPHKGVSGPLWVRGGVPIVAADGETYEVRNRVTLCRCGASERKPFCDGSHISINYNDGDPSLKR